MSIYTRTGDKGKTSLFGGKRVLKTDLRIETLGAIDELNSVLGVVLSEISNMRQGMRKELIRIQNDLLEMGSNLANPKLASQGEALQRRAKEFEDFMDKITKQMPSLKNFILPGGGRTGAMLHLARAVCRRAERKIVELAEKHPSVSSGQVIIYFNRLSDLLFTMARFVNFKEKRKEKIWSGQKF